MRLSVGKELVRAALELLADVMCSEVYLIVAAANSLVLAVVKTSNWRGERD